MAAGPALDSDPAAEPAPVPPPGWTAADERSAAYIAAGEVGAYVAKGVPGPDWWAAVAARMTPGAQVAYAGTDPANVPGTRVTSAPAATRGPGGTAALALAVVPTDAGRWTVLLVRGDAGGPPWLVERLTPPPGTH